MSSQGQDGLCDGAPLAGRCGTYCGACLAYHGEIAKEASQLVDRLTKQGFLGLARRIEPEQEPAINAFFEVMDRIARTPKCPGCGHGGGIIGCPVRDCASRRGYVTCADCDQLEGCATKAVAKQDPGQAERARRQALRDDAPAGLPFSAPALLERLTRKYQGWNLHNLRRIRRDGLKAWLHCMSLDPSFRTIERKTSEDVFREK
jgi:hypothetical protein